MKPVEPSLLLETINRIADRNWLKQQEESMADNTSDLVRFSCHCGKRMKSKVIHRGKRNACPKCGRFYVVP